MAFRRQKFATTLITTFLLSSVLTGCTFHFTKSKYVKDQKSTDSILVFGYMDDSEAPFKVKWGEIRQVRPTTDRPVKDIRSNKKGLFYLENLPAVGSYKMMNLGGPDKGFMSNSTWSWGFPEPERKPEFKRLEFRTKKPGLYFMGSYKIKLVKKGGFFSADKFETVLMQEPTEKDVLQQLMKYTEGTKWEHAVHARIKELK